MGYGPSRQDRGAGNHGEQPVQFKLADAQRIASVVGQVEGSRRGRKNSSLPRAAGGGITVATATFTGAWSKGTDKTITLRVNTAQTAVATNLFANITAPASGTKTCCVFLENDKYILFATECD